MDPKRWSWSRKETVCWTESPLFDTSERCIWGNDRKSESSLKLRDVITADKDLGVIRIQQSPEEQTSKRAAIWTTVGSRHISYSGWVKSLSQCHSLNWDLKICCQDFVTLRVAVYLCSSLGQSSRLFLGCSFPTSTQVIWGYVHAFSLVFMISTQSDLK